MSLIGIMREMVAYVRTAWRTSRKPPPRDALLANAPGEHSRRALPARGLHESAPQILGHFDPNANWANVLDKCPADSGARCAGLLWGTLRRALLGHVARGSSGITCVGLAHQSLQITSHCRPVSRLCLAQGVYCLMALSCRSVLSHGRFRGEAAVVEDRRCHERGLSLGL